MSPFFRFCQCKIGIFSCFPTVCGSRRSKLRSARGHPGEKNGGGGAMLSLPQTDRVAYFLFCSLFVLNEQVYGVVDEAAHKAAGGLPVVRVAQALIKAPIEDVALCWWQAGRRKVGMYDGLLSLHPSLQRGYVALVCWPDCCWLDGSFSR